jgi:hypothetical protein
MNEVVRQLSTCLEEWQAAAAGIPEIDLGKIRRFDFQEDLQKRSVVSNGLKGRECLLCADFEEHVGSLSESILRNLTTDATVPDLPYASYAERTYLAPKVLHLRPESGVVTRL